MTFYSITFSLPTVTTAYGSLFPFPVIPPTSILRRSLASETRTSSTPEGRIRRKLLSGRRRTSSMGRYSLRRFGQTKRDLMRNDKE